MRVVYNLDHASTVLLFEDINNILESTTKTSMTYRIRRFCRSHNLLSIFVIEINNPNI